MTASLAAPAAAALPPSGGSAGLQGSQNLFEHMASNAQGMPQGAGPHQIGEGLMERLNGFIDRSRTFSERADVLTNGSAPGAETGSANTPATSGAQTPASGQNLASSGQPPKKVGEQQVDQIVHSLGKMFDYSIETQMVVRGATQISGSANTLLKGQ